MIFWFYMAFGLGFIWDALGLEAAVGVCAVALALMNYSQNEDKKNKCECKEDTW